ncbi:hypothetical protein FLX27_05490 [Agrobacterium tumefaciens]|nr:hypothetical protein [Agrobacterium tumefaciens]TQN63015.1 hypothetical protein FLX27_05490 [Agrobacterium tumefaciens]
MRVVQELEVVEVSYALHPTRRVVILQRKDGFYSYAEQYYYVSEDDGGVVGEGWCTLPAEGIYADLHVAVFEGRTAFVRQHGIA